MNPSLSALMLCAGYGTRLRPLTERIPKPLIPFGGKSALNINVERVRALNPASIVCNAHHLAGSVKREADTLNIRTVEEPDILGTGGCFDNARKHLAASDYILAHNADVLHNIPLEPVLKNLMDSDALGILIGIDNPTINTLVVDSSNNLKGVSGDGKNTPIPEHSRLTFTGIAFYRKEFLDFCPAGPGSVLDIWNKAMETGKAFKVWDASKYDWHDFGNPQDLWNTSIWYRNTHLNSGIGSQGHQTNQIINECNYGEIPENARNLLILEIPETPPGKGTRDAIIGLDFKWDIQVKSLV